MLVACLVPVLAAPRAFAIPSAEAIARVNALRAMNGIPADVLEDPALSAGCQAHAHYAAVNRGFDAHAPHNEVASKPGYSAQGDDAASHSVLASAGWRDPN